MLSEYFKNVSERFKNYSIEAPDLKVIFFNPNDKGESEFSLRKAYLIEGKDLHKSAFLVDGNNEKVPDSNLDLYVTLAYHLYNLKSSLNDALTEVDNSRRYSHLHSFSVNAIDFKALYSKVKNLTTFDKAMVSYEENILNTFKESVQKFLDFKLKGVFWDALKEHALNRYSEALLNRVKFEHHADKEINAQETLMEENYVKDKTSILAEDDRWVLSKEWHPTIDFLSLRGAAPEKEFKARSVATLMYCIESSADTALERVDMIGPKGLAVISPSALVKENLMTKAVSTSALFRLNSESVLIKGAPSQETIEKLNMMINETSSSLTDAYQGALKL